MKSILLSSLLFIVLILIGCNQKDKELLKLKMETTMIKDISEKNKRSVLNFLKALGNKNMDKVVNLFAEDGVHINPYSSGLFPEEAKGKDGIRSYWEPVFPNFGKMEFPVDEIYAMEDPTIVFVKFKGKIELLNDAGYYNNDYYATFKFNEEGEITEYVEIFNPILAAREFGMLDKIRWIIKKNTC